MYSPSDFSVRIVIGVTIAVSGVLAADVMRQTMGRMPQGFFNNLKSSARTDAQIAGFCVARVEAAPAMLAEAGRAEITELFVNDAARRRGLGRVLAESALRWAVSRSVSRIEVRVSARNEAGRAFWRTLGFGAFVDVLDRRL